MQEPFVILGEMIGGLIDGVEVYIVFGQAV